MRIAVYPGSFDPVTNGHIDIIERAAPLCDKLIVAVLRNNNKNCTFAVEERVGMLQKALAGMDNVQVDSFDGLLVDYARQTGAQAIIRGLRMVSDFESELAMASMNKKMAHEVETVFLMTSNTWSHVSSSMVKEIGGFGGDISDMVPPAIRVEIEAGIKQKEDER